MEIGPSDAFLRLLVIKQTTALDKCLESVRCRRQVFVGINVIRSSVSATTRREQYECILNVNNDA